MGILRCAAAYAALIFLVSCAAAAAAPVRVDGGLVQGETVDGIAVYKGIPFAAPPVGELRWRPPQPVVPWEGIKTATGYGPACAQAPVRGRAPPAAMSEDCLYLNVWVPPHAPGAKLPVMVWIYGGAFEIGWTSNPVYDGLDLARKGVIVVSVAYRVGPLGFLATPELSAESPHHVSGDYGLLDQIAGLEWVQRNIAGFGGDPMQVTIFGESAGGMSVNMLGASPLAKGLFARAISESGGATIPPRRAEEGGLVVVSLAHAEAIGSKFLKALGANTLAQARALSADRIVDAPGAGFTGDDTGMIGGNFWAVAEGYALPDSVYGVYEAGRQNDTPVLIGTNSDEGAVFPHPRTAAAFRRYVRAKFGPYAKDILTAYPADSDAQAEKSASALTGNAIIVWPSRTWAALQAKTGKSKVFVYEFTRHVAPANAREPTGATHGSEIPYVFDDLSSRPGLDYTQADRQLAGLLSSYWTNFAKTGDPNAAGLPAWPDYTNASPRMLLLNTQPAVAAIHDGARMETLSRYFAWRRQQERRAP